MAVSALSWVYIIWTALSYLVGNVQITHTELIVRVMKIAVVSTCSVLSIVGHFFIICCFVGGVEQILQMITEAEQPGLARRNTWMMLAPQTLSSCFLYCFIVDWMGFIYITILLCFICF